MYPETSQKCKGQDNRFYQTGYKYDILWEHVTRDIGDESKVHIIDGSRRHAQFKICELVVSIKCCYTNIYVDICTIEIPIIYSGHWQNFLY